MPRVGLSTDTVVDIALNILDETGDVTLARVASRAGVAPPSLYKHVTNLAQLRDLIALAAMTELEDRVTRPPEDDPVPRRSPRDYTPGATTCANAHTATGPFHWIRCTTTNSPPQDVGCSTRPPTPFAPTGSPPPKPSTPHALCASSCTDSPGSKRTADSGSHRSGRQLRSSDRHVPGVAPARRRPTECVKPTNTTFSLVP